MVTYLSPKNPLKFYCQKCDYSTSNKKDWRKHCSTTKHQNGNKMVTKSPQMVKFVCDQCSRTYKYASGLSRHKKKCHTMTDPNVLNSKRQTSTEVTHHNQSGSQDENIANTLHILSERLVKQSEIIEQLLQNQTDMIPKLGSNNKSLSINVYLNEHCKDAMNITDFMENIKVSLDDLKYTTEHGYVKGITNIFNKHLSDMKVTERPIHCSDAKRLKFYVKDADTWERDSSHQKIDKTINLINAKQMKQIKEWEKRHPNYLTDDALVMEWHTMIYKMMGGGDDETRQKNNNSIKKQISSNVVVKDVIDVS